MSLKLQPLVSVVTPVYNAEKWIGEAVESIIDQKYVGEVLLVEDGSEDKSLSVCIELSERMPQVRIFRHDDGKNHWAAASRNLGIRHAKFELIAFLDADDIYLPDRFGIPIQIMIENPAVDGVYEAIGTAVEDADAEKRWAAMGWGDITTVRKVLKPEELFYYLVMWEAGHFSLDGLVVKKNLLNRVGGLNKSLRLHEDTDICIKMAAVGNLVPGRLDEPVALRRVHARNTFITKRKNSLKSRLLVWRSLDDWAKESKQSLARRLIIRYQLNRLQAFYFRRERKWSAASFYSAKYLLMRRAIYMRRTILGARSF